MTVHTQPRLFKSATAAALVLVANVASAQLQPLRSEAKVLSDKPDRTVVALEYIPATRDLQKAGGLGVYRISEDGPGMYLQFVTDLDQETPRVGGDPARFPEPTNRRFTEATLINVGVTGRLNNNLTLFGGLGLASLTPVTEKRDSVGRLSRTGVYYVEDGARRENRLNIQVGVQFRLDRVAAGVSYNSELDAPQFSLGFAF